MVVHASSGPASDPGQRHARAASARLSRATPGLRGAVHSSGGAAHRSHHLHSATAGAQAVPTPPRGRTLEDHASDYLEYGTTFGRGGGTLPAGATPAAHHVPLHPAAVSTETVAGVRSLAAACLWTHIVTHVPAERQPKASLASYLHAKVTLLRNCIGRHARSRQ